MLEADIFGWLSDSWRVLATTPAWSQVSESISNVRLIESGAGNRATLEKDSRNIISFNQILADATPTILRLLWCSALLRGVAHRPPNTWSLDEGLSLLSDGLGFSRIDSSEVATRTELLVHELEGVFGIEIEKSLPGVGGPKPPSLTSKALPQILKELSTAAGRQALDWDSLRNDAWKSFEQRLWVNSSGADQPAANFAEIVCAARGVGPVIVMDGLDFDMIPLVRWSFAFLTIAGLVSVVGSREQIPSGIAFFALRRLGADQLPASVIDRLMRLAVRDEKELEVLRMMARRHGMQGGSQHRAALVVRTSAFNVTDKWFDVPRQGLVLVIDALSVDVGRAVLKLHEAFASRDFLLVWEEPVAPADSKRILDAITKVGPIKQIHMYSHNQPDMVQPAIADPYEPDAVFSALM